ncbi:YcaO-like family protein [Halorhodospira abdelmalekii]|uniref:YcaO-like family protein n=1 Tax=Halorhodospira abdelmalekii TaxID=421629 RepID=UPI0019051345|nr:YcaO-like family protein [Halorhodospira abdelmalekii]
MWQIFLTGAMGSAWGHSLCGEVEECIKINDEPKYPSFTVFPSEFAATRYRCDGVYGSAIDTDTDRAKAKACGEMVERLALENCPEEISSNKVAFISFATSEAVDPHQFHVDDYRGDAVYRKQGDDLCSEPLSWSKCVRLPGEEEVLIPSQLIYLDKVFDQEYPLRLERISTGTACGPLGSGLARANALCEVIERHNAINAYLSHESMVEVIGVDGDIKRAIDYCKRYRLETRLFVASYDTPLPTFIAVTIDRTGGGPAINIGSSSKVQYRDAMLRAILESIQFRFAARLHVSSRGLSPLARNDVISSERRMEYWGSLDRIESLDWWLSAPPQIAYDDLEDKFKVMRGLDIDSDLADRYLGVFECDISPPEALSAGFEVKKVLVPGMAPLYLDEFAATSKHIKKPRPVESVPPHPFS